MTFKKWAKRDFWKPSTPHAFEPIWNALSAAGHKPEEIATMLDHVGSAVSDEFGGSWPEMEARS